jgi:hypothetical protein
VRAPKDRLLHLTRHSAGLRLLLRDPAAGWRGHALDVLARSYAEAILSGADARAGRLAALAEHIAGGGA